MTIPPAARGVASFACATVRAYDGRRACMTVRPGKAHSDGASAATAVQVSVLLAVVRRERQPVSWNNAAGGARAWNERVDYGTRFSNACLRLCARRRQQQAHPRAAREGAAVQVLGVRFGVLVPRRAAAARGDGAPRPAAVRVQRAGLRQGVQAKGARGQARHQRAPQGEAVPVLLRRALPREVQHAAAPKGRAQHAPQEIK
ncbi:zinc finger protein [Gracilaria domingensis]|nr:zinc finger protein [Gracilaria domingensis]